MTATWDHDYCMCDAMDDETGERVGWIACPESLCERPDHSHAASVWQRLRKWYRLRRNSAILRRERRLLP